jgi:hypothetical protein
MIFSEISIRESAIDSTANPPRRNSLDLPLLLDGGLTDPLAY